VCVIAESRILTMFQKDCGDLYSPFTVRMRSDAVVYAKQKRKKLTE